MTSALSLDAKALAGDLSSAIAGEVRFSDGDRALYATDASNYRQVPIGVVIPRTVDDVYAVHDISREHGAPILNRGAGTSLAGQCCNVAVVIDWTKYLNQVIAVDPDAKTVRVQPGCILDDAQRAAAPHRLRIGPDPATHNHCTIGGMIGNNACGIHAVMSGQMSENVRSLDVLTYDGTSLTVGRTTEEDLRKIAASGGRTHDIYERLHAIAASYGDKIRERFPRIPRLVSGFRLDHLLPEHGFNVASALVGTEGTCATVLEAEVDLIHDPAEKVLLVLGFPGVVEAGHAVPDVMRADPIGCEGFDRMLFQEVVLQRLHLETLKELPKGGAWLLAEFGADSRDEAEAQARRLVRELGRSLDDGSARIFTEPHLAGRVWEVRESALAATSRTPAGADAWPGWEDSAVPPDRLGNYLADLRALYDDYGYSASLYGHFGQGCVHTRVNFDLRSAAGLNTFRAFLDDAADACVSYGGSLSGEHGDGQARGELLPKMFGPELVRAFQEFKAVWDPDNRMNPGKVVDPNPILADLRLGADYAPAEPVTFFGFPEDDGSFSRAALRCVGVGKCRKTESGTMCPSYMVTLEEKHSTRGRARLLFEMLNGSELDGWQSDDVADALDLCLACKGCKGECPVNVDMATYKAEFLAHRYRRRLRPANHYALGLIPFWARVASKAPRLVNAITQRPGLDSILKRTGGIATERGLPQFADQTFKQWFHEYQHADGTRTEVMLWPDTFTNHFDPQIGAAAVRVLEAAGCRVTVPDQWLCCGLPMISTGMIKTAKRLLHRTVRSLREKIRTGVPLVGLEPSCTAVFRHDLHELFPHDEDAGRLAKQTFTLSEFLTDRVEWKPPELARRVLVQTHCHEKAIIGDESERKLLTEAGIDHEFPDSGCCGLAGNFGFERGHYDVSMACAERVLLPAVRDAAEDTLIVADGFSCRTQIEQATDRDTLHLAQVLEMGLDERRARRGR